MRRTVYEWHGKTHLWWHAIKLWVHMADNRMWPTASSRLRLKCDVTRADTRFRLSAKRTSPFTSARASVQSTTGSRGMRISGSNAGCTMFRGSVKGTGYPLHSPVSPSLPPSCVTVCHHISTGLWKYKMTKSKKKKKKDRERESSPLIVGLRRTDKHVHSYDAFYSNCVQKT